MGTEAWSALFAGIGVLAALASILIALRANGKADRSNQIAKEANELARRSLGVEEDRDRAASRPELDVRLGEGRAPNTFDVRVSHDGTQPLHVQLKATHPQTASFAPSTDFLNQEDQPLPQDEERDLGMVEPGKPTTLQIVWRNLTEQKTTIISTVHSGNDSWKKPHLLDLNDDSRFD